MDTELQQLEKTQRNPIQETRYQELKKSQGAGTPNAQSGITGAISALNPESVVRNATQVNDFVRQQNQPVVQSYEASKAPLQQRYKDLIDSIKGNQQIAENRQTVTTNNELGKRGITGSSGVAQQELTNAVNPITQQYTGMIKDSTNQQNMDLSNIDAIIAKLNAGDPTASLSTATNIGQSQQSANEFAQTLAQQQEAQRIAQENMTRQFDAQQKQQALENAIAQLQSNFQEQSNPLQLALLQAQVKKAQQSNQAPQTSLEDLMAQFGG